MSIAPGVNYVSIADLPGQQFFRCSVLRSTLRVESCAANWRRSQLLRPGQVTCRHLCRLCPIGATHAGEAHVHRSPIFAADFCPRCRKGTTRRMIGGNGAARCVSCFNREAEVKKGRDGRGNVPGLRLNTRRLAVILAHGREAQTQIEVIEKYTLDTVELALASLRVATGRIAFARPIGRPAITIADLAKRTAIDKLPNHEQTQSQLNATAESNRADLEGVLELRAVS
jgi:hypothetical protein